MERQQNIIRLDEPTFESISINNNDLEATINLDGQQYTVVLTYSYGSEVYNPDTETALALFSGAKKPQRVNPTLLLPIMANGRCAADCKGCVFANSRAEYDRRIAAPLTSSRFIKLLNYSLSLCEAHGLVANTSQIKVNALMSGDPAFSRFTYDVMTSVAQNPRVSGSRWSTIAAKNPNNVLSTFSRVAYDYPTTNIRFQVSLHSTSEKKRKAHVGHFRDGHFGELYTQAEIAEAFNKIKVANGSKSTLAFVVDEYSEIDSSILGTNFSPESTIISFRPMIPTNGEDCIQMDMQRFMRLYDETRKKGFDVVVMPSLTGSEMDNNISGIRHRD